jgi:hypothetical protein
LVPPVGIEPTPDDYKSFFTGFLRNINQRQSTPKLLF